MGINERKTREKEVRHGLILDKAKELILDRGVGALSMQDIADAAELSKATLYLYFDSKEALLGEILDEAAELFISHVEERIAAESTGLGALKVLWSSFLGIFGQSHELFVLIGIIRYIDSGASLLSSGEGPATSYMRGMRSLIARVLAWGVADGTLDPSLDPELFAKMVILISTTIIDTVARMPRESRETRIVREEMKATFELLLRGFAAPGTDRGLLALSLD
jgi:AcrR family transcriptional regulator